MRECRIARWFTMLMSMLLVGMMSHAQQLLLVPGTRPDSVEVEQVKALADFYGLTIRTLDLNSAALHSQDDLGPAKSKIVAIIASADTLPLLHRDLQARVSQRAGSPVPLLIFDIGTETDHAALERWSDGVVKGCIQPRDASRPTALHVANSPALNGVLSEADLPAVNAPACQIEVHQQLGAEVTLATVSHAGSSPMLLKTASSRGDVFFAPRSEYLDASWKGKPSSLAEAFSSLAPLLIFIQHAAGSYGWHLDGHYANLTIDDPWLTQPYGNLDYPRLLKQMEEHRFHTTIAFVPWNYDRSDAGVAKLLRDNPKYFSVCLHGNNHAHREFGDYAGNPLVGQVEDIRQGVARMESFHRLSGVKYDRFMVFPHGVAPDGTFAALKTYGFLGTANSINVPLGVQFPRNPLFLLRPYTTDYAHLLSLSRYSAEAPVPSEDLLIQAFLGNPILFYTHQASLRDGNRAVVQLVDTVNRIAPETQWTSLGEISRHLYQLRQRADGDFDVRMLSSEMRLSNQSAKDARFHISVNAPESSTSGVLLDGHLVPVERNGDAVALSIPMVPGQVHTIRVRYATEAQIAGEKARRGDMRVYALRQISDFRDLFLSVHGWGRTLIGSYYDGGGESLELRMEKRWRYAVGVVVVGLAVGWYRFRMRRNRSSKEASLKVTGVLS